MRSCVKNIISLLSVPIKRDHFPFIGAGKVFFGFLFFFAFGFNVQAQTATITILTSTTNPSCLNDAITLTATVDQSLATGNVQFLEGATVLGNISLDANGTATLSLSNLSAGNHSILASYEGIAPFDGSVSAAINHFVNSPATITGQPSGKTVALGCSASFSVTADGTGPFNYQWRKNGVDISGANSATLTINNVASPDEGNYDVIVSNLCGNIISNAASLGLLPSLNVALTSQTDILCFGSATGTIDIAAEGGMGPYTFAWTGTGVNANAEDQSGLAAGNYSVIVTDANGCTTSSLPVTISQPALIVINNISSNSFVCSGNTLNLFSNASGGTGVLNYSWSGPDGFTSVLQNPSIPNVTTLANGAYTLTVRDENACAVTATTNVTITQRSTVSISYPAAALCRNNSTPQLVALTGTGTYTGGTYSSFPAGLSINSSNGTITPNTSAAGSYTVTYLKAAIDVCGNITATTTVIITALPVATFSYTGTPFCQNATNPIPVFSGGGVAGNFTSSAGLVFVNSSTGQIDLAASTPGSYVVTNTIAAANGCGMATANSSVTITAVPTATINYAGSPFCKSLAAAQGVTINGTGAYTGGTYSASPSGLTLNTSTGSITPSTSTAGNYTVTYSKAAAGGCAAISTSTSVTVTALPAATITYGASQYCSGITTPQVVTKTGTAGGTYSSVPAGLGIDPVTGTIVPSDSEPGTYTVRYTMSSNGCPDVIATRTITINATPTVFISSDYCAGGGNVRLTANATPQPVTYLWSNGSTASTILVDKAGTYTFTATTPQGCSATSFTNVAQELVYNGDFSLGNTGFTSAYGNNQAPYTGGSTGLWPETLYAVDSNARIHHSNFFGTDHTTGDGNFMIVNGAGYDTTTVWRQSFAVQPNTTYYFSAWAMSLNRVSPYAQLKFTVNDSLFGTTAVLAPGANSTAGPFNWVRFYGTWNSGSNTFITISIVDLQTAAGGNDFGLDDISFGTLSPIPFSAAPTGAACEGQTLVLNSNVVGGTSPYFYSWTGPNGFTSNAKDPVIPNATTAHSGTYTLNVTDGYSCPITANALVTVGQAAIINAGPAQGVCSGGTITLAGTRSGSATSSTWNAPGGTFSNINSLNSTYTPSISSGSVTLTLTSNNPAGSCPAAVSTVVITVSNATANAGPDQIVCSGGTVNLSGSIGGSATSATWSATGGIFSNINSLTSTYTPSITSGTVTLTLTTNDPPGACGPAVSTVIITVKPSPTVAALTPAVVCIGSSVVLTANNSGGNLDQTFSGASGTINQSIPDNNTVGHTSTITLSGAGALSLAASDNIQVSLNLTHGNADELDIFLVDPSGTRAMLLSSDNGGTGNNYTNTIFNTGVTNVIGSTGNNTAPFSNTYRPEGTISTAPDRTGAASAGNYNAVIPASSLLGAAINGGWRLKVFDDNNSSVGTFISWSLSVTKSGIGNYTTTFSGPGAIGAVSYSGANNSTASTTVTAPVGNNTYTIVTTDAGGCTDTENIIVTVNPLAIVDAGGPDQVCRSANPSPITLNGAFASGAATTGAWLIVSGGGSLSSTAQTTNPETVTYTPAANFNGTVTLRLTTNDPLGPCGPVNDTRTITVNALPVVNAGAYSAVCISTGTINLSGTPVGGVFSGPGVTGNSFVPATAGAGTHPITYTYTNGNGCTNSATTNITVNPLPVVSAGTYASVCINNGIVTLSGSPSGGIFSGPGVSGTSFNPLTAGVGTHSIAYSYTNGNGCSATATTQIDVKNIVATQFSGVACVNYTLPWGITVTASGNYVHTYQTINGCDSVVTARITINNAAATQFTAANCTSYTLPWGTTVTTSGNYVHTYQTINGCDSVVTARITINNAAATQFTAANCISYTLPWGTTVTTSGNYVHTYQTINGCDSVVTARITINNAVATQFTAANCLSYTLPWGTTVTTSGNYVHTYQTINGCDSVVTARITINNAAATQFTAANCTSYTLPWGTTVTTSGNYVHTYQTINGCDSVVTARITINNAAATQFTAANCISYTLPWGTTVTTSGNYVHTYQTVNGCDSVVTARITINNAAATQFTAANCISYTLPWGTTVTTSGNYVHTYQTVNGCDSVVTARITINNAAATQFTAANCLSYTLPWGTSVTTSGNYVHTYQTINGCDSVVTARITINNAVATQFTAANCLSYTLPWGATVTTSGNYVHTYQTINGCDSVVTARITINNAAATQFTAANCLSYTLPWGTTVTTSGNYVHTYQTINGCDSVVTARITINNAAATQFTATNCLSYTLPWGTTVTTSGNYVHTYQTVSGCDSVVTARITINPVVATDFTQAACLSYILPWGTIVTTSGDYVHTYQTINGCDSVVTARITINNAVATQFTAANCISYTLPWGTTVTTSGNYVHTYQTINGCDSVVTARITINNAVATQFTAANCISYTLPWGTTVTTSGNYVHTYQTINGCDSVVTARITISPVVATDFTQAACLSYTLPWGTTVATSGNYVHTYQTTNGCDSVVTARITINNAAATQFTAANCLSYTLPWGTTVTTSGNYVHTYQTVNGCDSVVTARITINNAAATQFTAANCISYTLPWGTTVTTSGNYVHTYQTINGCDSVVTARITINNAAATQFTAANCISYTLPWGTTVTTSGNYVHTYQTVNGCDSVVTARITINPVVATDFIQAACLSYTLPWGTIVTTSGNYVHTYQTINGCDSVVTARITINNAAATQFSAANCTSYTLPWGTTVTTSGNYVHTYQTVNGCDSVVTARITINNAAATQFTAANCTSYTLPWGTTVTTSGNYVHTYQTINGCDSVVTARITINNAAATQFTAANCISYTLPWGTIVTTSGNYVHTYQTVNGCDSVVTARITISPVVATDFIQAACLSYTLPWGTIVTTSGNYVHTYQTINGCDSVVTARITINNAAATQFSAANCTSYTLPWGTTVTTSGNYVHTYQTVNGCDSVVTARITINNAAATQFTAANCTSYTLPWGTTVTTSGNYVHTYQTINGCDSVVTARITINNAAATQFTAANCISYTLPWGTTVTTSGNYVHTYQTVNGCDSVVTARITINNAAATQFTAANCTSYTLPWGTTVTTSGNYVHTYQTINGCDSVVTARITINNAAATQFTAANCISYTLPWGTTVTTSGDYVHTYQTVNGCDSVVTARITINNAAATQFTAANCLSYTLPWGTTVTTSGNYVHTYQTVNGCDSVVTARITINNAVATQFTAANCISYTLPWGTTVTTSGNYVHTYQTVNGCDSVVTARITINNAAATQFTAANCTSYTLPWGTTVTTSGNYVHTYQTINGCDSVVTAHITINNAAATQFTAANCISYTLPWGTTATTSGDYVRTYQTINGCDSVVTARITINNAAATQFTAANCISYTLPWGTTVATSGDYVHTYQTINGCDSVVTARITINNAAATQFTAANCISYTLPWGTTVTTSGNYVHTYQTINGCDSVVTARITISPVVATEFTQAACLSYTLPWGTTVTTSGDYVHTYQTINGCDSVVTARITINNAAATQFTAANCISYTLPWGTTVTTSGNYVHTYQTINGCDSVVTARITISPVVATDFTQAACLSYTLPWGTTVTTSGNYVHTYQTVNGCDSVVTARITINNTTATQFTAANCTSYTLPWGTTVTTSGNYVHTYQTVNGCDSVVTARITISPVVATDFTQAACLSYTLPWGTTVATSGDYVHTYQTINGCDSVVTARITISPVVATDFTQAACLSYTLPWGTTVTTSGNYVHTYQTVNGCDSVVTARITINNAAAAQFTAANCISYTLPWGTTVTTSGNYVHTYQTINGCDSVVTARITISPVVATDFTQAACLSYTLPWGITVTTSGDYVHTYQTINGCDSVVTARITISPVVATDFTQAACLSYTLPWGITVTTSGDYVHTYQTINGCDSVVTARITINDAAATQFTAANCLSYTLPWGTIVTTSGDYVHTYQTINGCDSVVTARITINNAAATQFTAANCISYTLPWGTTVTTSGDYVHTYQTVNGCDSVVTASVTISPVVATDFTQAACLSYTLPWGTTVTTSGDYVHTYQTINGCDSVVTARITINNAAATQFTGANCISYTLPWGTTVTTSGNYVHTYQTVNGCDSVVTARITINNAVATQFTAANCISYTLPWGTTVTTSGNYVHTYQTINGCDSVVTARITISPVVATEFTQAACLSYTLPWGTTVTTSGNYVHTYQTVNGCDSVVTARITINNAVATQFTAANCISYTLPWGTTVTTSGNYVHTYQTINGCDSVVTARITISPVVATEFTQAACLSYTLPWGTIVTTSGNYVHTYQTINGCDSVVTARITINNAAATQFTATNCLSYTLPWGTTVTTSGNYVHTYQTINGCDSVVTARITINNNVESTRTITVCEAALPYNWNNQSLTAAGDYSATLISAAGCDSIVTLHLNINPIVTGEETITICEAALPYSWNNQSITAAGDYTTTLVSVNGCDSIATLHLKINPVVTGEETITICEAALPYNWNNQSITAAGDYTTTLVSVNGCDSIATLHLKINPVVTGEETITICEAALPYNWNNQAITAAGDYTTTLVSVSGCDSVATLHLVVTPVVTGEETITICEAALPYSWNNQAVTAAGDYTTALVSVNGCDSIATLHLVVTPVVTGEETIAICEAALPYNWNNQSITAAGDYTTTLVSVNGCDSIATLHLIITPVVTDEETITICEAALPYNWNNQSITAAGDYTATLVSVNGCDSIATLHLKINPVVTGEETITICEAALPYNWNNQSITAAGDYTATLVSINGCDSVATLHLIINPVVTGEETITICEAALPYNWNNQSITAAGDYTATLVSVKGCDSIATLHLIINPVVTGEKTITICEAALPYNWNNQAITAAGDYTTTLVSIAGCDSVATLHLIITPVVTGEETITICEAALPYNWNNQSITAAGDYTATLVSVKGCDSIATLHLIINPVVTGEETITICEAALPYNWNNQAITAAGDYTTTLVSIAGCDSVATLHLIITPVVTGEETITICEAALPYNWNNQSITAAGDYTATLVSVKGCDSTATLHLIINPVVTGEETITICEAALPYSWNNQSITAAGDYTTTLVSVNGCDSIATLHLKINPVVTGEETITICEAALPYNWNNQSITAAGDYTAALVSVNGCDSIATLHLVVTPVVTGEETIAICKAALPYNWNNQSITAAGDYTTTLVSVNGCDSVATLHLIINPVVTGEETITICEAALPFNWNNQSITAAGDYTATLVSVKGCDSIATLHLIINPVVTGEETITICEAALPYNWNNQAITAAGDYTTTLVSIAGCDSIATLHLIITPVVTGEETITICEAALPYSWNNQSITAAGDYTATLVSATGCDSIATLHLIITPVVTGEETITICEAALPYSWNNQSITADGDYTATLVSAAGCDSIATLHLIITPVVTGEETIAICEAALPYNWNNQAITAPGDYTAALANVNGCDSIATLHLKINPVVTGEETITICEAALPYSWNNQSIIAAGDYTATLVSVNGCDSVATLHLIITPVVTGEETITICEAALPYNWNNQAITAAGDYTVTLTSASGCDSIATLHLIINPLVTGEETITICEAALPYSWNNQSITAAGDYTAALVSVNGCDSIATLHLKINPVVTGEETITICEAALPYNWNNQSITAAGDYTAALVSVNGCDSIATLHLKINPVVTGKETITICEAALPYSWNNQAVTAAGDYTTALVSVNGCDSIATLHLIINPVVTGEETITICEAALPYSWNNQSIIAAGDYTAALKSTVGCDSVATLHLIINPIVTGEETITICEAALPYNWNNQAITAAGDYTTTLVSVAGCDSVATLHLIITPVVTGEQSITICEGALPYSWNNQSITAAGNYTTTLVSDSGCDSVATLHLLINPFVTGEETITICDAALPYNWNNQAIIAAGDYTTTLVSVAGCDSIATLHLIITPVVTGEETITICEAALPYNWNTQVITDAGDYTTTLVSVAGCDSIATLHLITTPIVTGEETITICEAALPYNWNTQFITAAGDYTATLVSVNGCDSIATLHLIVNPVVTGEETITVCEAALPYSWNNQSIIAAGDYTATLVSVNGCDSIATLHLIINPVVTGEETITICEAALPYSWNNQSITAAGDYNATLVSVAGCDSIATLHLLITPVVTGEETITICEAALPYSWNNQSIVAAGDYTATFISVNGCDSIATLHLIVTPQAPAPIVAVSPAICSSLNGIITITSPAPGNGITYSINGIDFQASNIFTTLAPGNYIITVKDMNGCISSINVTVGQTTNTFTINQTITNISCTAMNGAINVTASGSTAPYTYAWSGPGNFSSAKEDVNGLAAGDYMVIVTDANGCTQTQTIKVSQSINTITLNQSVENAICTANNGSINLIVNNGSAPYSYKWTGPDNFSSTNEDLNGLAAGDYTVLVTDVNGCSATSTIKVSQVINTITLNKVVTDATCSVKDGSINLIVNGGNAPYAYSWTGPSGYAATMEDLSNLAPGTYAVMVTDQNGCVSGITAVVGQSGMAPIVVTHDIYSCSPANLTDPTVTAGSDQGLVFSYWLDAAATHPVADPTSVLAGTYYIKGTNTSGCYSIKPVIVTIEATPVFITANPEMKCESETVDLTEPVITAGSDPRLTFTYWNDAETTSPLANPQAVRESGIYYIKAQAIGGCTFVKAVEVVVTLSRGSKSVRYPTITVSPNTSVQLSAREPGLVNNYTWYPPAGLNASDRKDPEFRHDKNMEYTIRIDYGNQCPVIDTVLVVMRQADPGVCVSDIFVPKAWSPNNDRHNDKLFPIPVCISELKYFRVFNRWGQLVFETNILGVGWDGTFHGQPQVSDTYTWTLVATGEDGKYYKRAGNSVLLR